jgi:drug/metabolite transporter (DMT)-like permease
MALERLPGPLVIIIFFTHTLMLLFYMAWRGEIKLDAVTVLTTLMALTGLSLVLDLWHQKSSAELWGIALAFGAAVTAVIRLYVYGHQVRTRHPVTVGAESFLIAAALRLCVLLFGKPVAPATLTGAGYAVLGCVAMALGTFGMFYGIMMLGSFRWSLYAKMEPVLTALFSALLIGEMLKPAQYGGMAVVLGSLILYQIVDGRKNAAVFDEEMG